MSEKIRPDEFRESMDRCLSGVKADPFLAGRVIASKEGEPRMKRKLSVSLVFALVALLALGTVAYSATILFRSVNFDGEVVSTEPPRDLNDCFYGSDMTAAETKALVEQTADDVPDDIYCQAWYSSPKDGATYLSTHRRTKKCTSYEEFLECMKGVNNLHLPVLPHTHAFEYVTGMKMTMGDFMRAGERGYTLERYVDCRFGVSAANDTLPKRLTDVPQDPKDPTTRVPLAKMKGIYYEARGWSADGRPKVSTLKRLKII